MRKNRLDCLYKFKEYGGEQCWDCPLVKDCIEQSSIGEKKNDKKTME
ncbi:MAG: hypothetical protein ACFFAU_01170 [Candidatus Hodarchaeota archaeon]